MAYLTEAVPDYGKAETLEPGIRRVVARNPGIMTYHGTNTYLLECKEGVVVVDPGPEREDHAEAVLEACGGRLAAIVLTHYHTDHSGAVEMIRAGRCVPVFGHVPARAGTVSPDVSIGDGDMVFGLRAIHTPGHAADHLCYAMLGGVVLSGDHVMSWSSSVVSPPLGDMADYCSSLQRLIGRNDRVFFPGHGPPLPQPAAFTEKLLHHRVTREAEILELLRTGAAEPQEIVGRLYAKRDPRLLGAAQRNVEAHIGKMEREGLVRRGPDGWIAA